MGKVINRNRNVDILRALAIIIIVVYHTYVLAGNPYSEHANINRLLSFGGELGVTLFFLLSGFGIFYSLYIKEQTKGLPSWPEFMKSRCRKIMPPYYICIIVLLIFQSTSLIGAQGWKTILAYFCFAQNLFVSTLGAINGALWALATIFQFYLIAPFLYRLVRKSTALSIVLAVGITVLCKFLIYNFALTNADTTSYFVYGRQLISALDNFVLGMAAAKIVLTCRNVEGRKVFILLSLITAAAVIAVCYLLNGCPIYSNTPIGYTAHSILAAVLMLLIIFCALSPQIKTDLLKPVYWIADNQYGIYLWHMPIIVCLGAGSELFVYLRENTFVLYALLILIIACLLGGFYFKGMNRLLKKEK